MYFEQVPLEKVKEQIESGEILVMSSSDGAPEKESWLQLCELAAMEQDPKKLLALVQNINRLLDKKE